MNRAKATQIIFGVAHIAKQFYEEAWRLMRRENAYIDLEREGAVVYLNPETCPASDNIIRLSLDTKFDMLKPHICRSER